MTPEVAILRAYAFASQGKYAEAEQLLASVPEALNTPPGADLFARIKFEQGDIATARRIWEELLVVDATNESVRNALAAIDVPLTVSEIDEPAPCFCRRRKYVCAAVLALLLGLAFSLGKAWQGRATPSKNGFIACTETGTQSRIIAEQTLDISKINAKVLSQLRDGILTNMNDNTMLVLSGGRGKYNMDRQNCLSVIAETVCIHAKVPLSKILFKASEKNDGVVKMTVVRGMNNDN